MEEEEKKGAAKREAAGKGAPKGDSSAGKTGADAAERTETTARDGEKKDTAEAEKTKTTAGGEKELKG